MKPRRFLRLLAWITVRLIFAAVLFAAGWLCQLLVPSIAATVHGWLPESARSYLGSSPAVVPGVGLAMAGSSETTPSLPDSFICTGRVDTEDQVSRLCAEFMGKIERIPVEEGQVYDKDTPLVCLNDSDQRSLYGRALDARDVATKTREQAEERVRQAEHALARYQSDLETTQIELRKARADLEVAERHKDSAPKTILSAAKTGVERLLQEQRRVEVGIASARNDVNIARKELEKAELALDSAEKQLDDAQRAVDRCYIKAPYRGRVLKIDARLGEIAVPDPRQTLVVFCPEKLVVRAEVPQQHASRVVYGMECEMRDKEDAGGKVYKGRISRVAPLLAPRHNLTLDPREVNDVRVLECIVEFQEENPVIRMGQEMRLCMKAQ